MDAARVARLLAVVGRMVELRLAAKSGARSAPRGAAERHTDGALSCATKLLANSAYGELGAVGLTRAADAHAANDVTRRGRATLALICHEPRRTLSETFSSALKVMSPVV